MTLPFDPTQVADFFRRIDRTAALRAGLAVGILLLCLYFVRREGVELGQALGQIRHSPWPWAVLSGLFSVVYVLCSAGMYRTGFAASGLRIPLKDTAQLFLKRNLVSVVLPAGGVSSLAFFNQSLTRQGVTASQQYVASTVYTIASFASLVLIAFPVLGLLLLRGTLTGSIITAFACLLAGLVLVFWLRQSWRQQRWVFRQLTRYAPALVTLINQVQGAAISFRYLAWASVWSMGVELCGITHLWLAMVAIGQPGSLEIALFGYAIATLLYAVSPVLRGIGVVELSLTYTLVQYGVPQQAAVAITLYYRFFEFWLPLLLGLGAFLTRKDNLLLRVLPALLVVVLGGVNIVSGLSPALADRVAWLEHFLSTDAMRLSSYTVVGLGVGLVFLSLYLIRGLRNAWLLTVLIVGLSVIGHLTKAIDYEEALFGCFVLAMLLYTRRNYTLSSDPALLRRAVVYLAGAGLLIYGYGLIGVWRFQPAASQNITTSLTYLNQLLALQPVYFLPDTTAGHLFGGSLQWLELLWLAGLAYSFIRPVLDHAQSIDSDRHKAADLLEQHGSTALDYFKLYPDKQLFMHSDQTGFIAYRTTSRYAVALEGPVAANEPTYRDTIDQFERFCHRQSRQTLYYRVDSDRLPLFQALGKKHLFIGQEATVSIAGFSLDGPARKSLRNGLRKLQTTGYQAYTHQPPLTDALVQQLRAVSDDWLHTTGREESGFTQGVFAGDEIRRQVVITINDATGAVVAFANLIPDYAPDEATYDLIRKSTDAPNGVLDALLIELINYAKAQGKQYLNLGMAPLSGILTPQNIPEMGMKFAYNHLRQLAHFKGLRFFKEKYADRWVNKYVVYDQDLDLVQLPTVLTQVSHYRPTSAT